MSRAGMKRSLQALQSPLQGRDNNCEYDQHERRDPKVSKTVSACTECQKRKIKCDLATRGDICGRCEKKGLQCVVNKSLQTLLKDGAGWKQEMEKASLMTQEAVSEILKVLNLPALETFGQRLGSQESNASASKGRPSVNVRFASELGSPANSMPGRQAPAAMAMTRENSQEPDLDNARTNAIVTDPMGSLYEVTKLRNIRSNPHSRLRQQNTSIEGDLISSGRVTLEDAEQLFDYFSTYLNAYLWGEIALVHSNLMAVRRSSTLLLAAILTVSALHVPGMENMFDVCYAEFVGLICDSMLDRYHILDGICGLTIGAFWLSDLSWKLSGHAVRIATELNLHQSFCKAMKGSSEHFEGARLWYFLPPVIHANNPILNHVKFLQMPQVTQADERLHSQVAIFVILTDIYNTFGPEIEDLTEQDTRVQQFNQRLNQWRFDWQQRLAPNPSIGSYPAQGVQLHYHYAKLQLNSLAVRGYTQKIGDLSPDHHAYARIAASSAVMILRITLEEPDITNAIVGVPLYLHTMITYATIFLLKVHRWFGSVQLGIEPAQIQDLVSRVIELLSNVKASRRHLAYHIASGLSKTLRRFTTIESRESTSIQAARDTTSRTDYEYPTVGAADTVDFDSLASYGDMVGYDLFFPFGFFDVLSTAVPE